MGHHVDGHDRLTFQFERHWPYVESFQTIHEISGLFLCGWVCHMCEHVYEVHTCVQSQRTAMGTAPHLFFVLF